MVLAAVAGYIVKSHAEPRYQSAVQVLVGPITGDDSSLSAAGQLVQTYAQVVTTQPLLSATIEDLGLSISPGELRGEVSASASDITRLLTIRVSDHDPAQAAQIANSLADNLADFAATGPDDPATGSSRPESELQVLEAAAPAASPEGPGTTFVVVVAAFAGLLAALAIALIVEYIRDTVRSGAEAAELSEVAFLGSVDGHLPPSTGRLLLEEMPNSPAATNYRRIATELEFSGDRELSSVLILGAQPGDQTGEVAANIAVAFAEAGRLVSLVDANPEEGAITKLFQLQGRPGIGDVFLRDRGAASDRGPHLSIQATRTPSLDVIPLGRADGADVVDLQNARDFLQTLLRERDLVIVNAASVERSSGALVWARSVDGTMIVARRDHTKRSVLARAAESLRLVGATLIGCALNEPQPRRDWSEPGDMPRERPHRVRDEPVPQPPLPTERPARQSRTVAQAEGTESPHQ